MRYEKLLGVIEEKSNMILDFTRVTVVIVVRADFRGVMQDNIALL